MQPLDHLVEQLWAPALSTTSLRVVTRASEPGWRDVERYWMVPDARRARLFLPRARAQVTAAACTNYRGLRPVRANAARGLAGGLARLHAPLGLSTARVQVRVDEPQAANRLPLAQIAAHLGHDHLFASFGVRTGANRKATLALVDPAGTPVGYAKLGWNSIADAFVSVETETLRRIPHDTASVRAPAALASLDYFGHPVLVTEPLPLDAVGAQRDVRPPSSAEFYGLTQLSRPIRPGATGHLRALWARLDQLTGNPLVADVARTALRLLDRVDQVSTELPTTRFWHGDMSPWNAARSPDGTLWIWDWETAEDDALAGLDPLHWVFSVHRLRHGSAGPIRLADVLHETAPHLESAGITRDDHAVVAATYALTVVERACLLAHRNDTWDNVWIDVTTLTALIAQAEALLQP